MGNVKCVRNQSVLTAAFVNEWVVLRQIPVAAAKAQCKTILRELGTSSSHDRGKSR